MRRIIADTQKITQHWERRCDELPYLIVKMSDGSAVRYNPEIKQHAFTRAMETLQHMTVGYERKEK